MKLIEQNGKFAEEDEFHDNPVSRVSIHDQSCGCCHAFKLFRGRGTYSEPPISDGMQLRTCSTPGVAVAMADADPTKGYPKP